MDLCQSDTELGKFKRFAVADMAAQWSDNDCSKCANMNNGFMHI